jgi:hypothetical protein
MSNEVEANVVKENKKNEFDNLNTSLSHYEYAKVLLESMEADVLKSEGGNKSASARVRKNLRHLKNLTTSYIRFTLKK